MSQTQKVRNNTNKLITFISEASSNKQRNIAKNMKSNLNCTKCIRDELCIIFKNFI